MRLTGYTLKHLTAAMALYLGTLMDVEDCLTSISFSDPSRENLTNAAEANEILQEVDDLNRVLASKIDADMGRQAMVTFLTYLIEESDSHREIASRERGRG